MMVMLVRGAATNSSLVRRCLAVSAFVRKIRSTDCGEIPCFPQLLLVNSNGVDGLEKEIF